MKINYVHDSDILVIGGGGAGIKAAIKAGETGAQVLLATKCKFGHTGSSFYPGTSGWGINAITHKGDSPEYFFEEIIEAGAGATDKELAKVLVDQSTPCFRELESYGIEFSKNKDGEYDSVISCFGKRVRGGGAPLDPIRKALWKQLMKNGVRVRDGISIISLVVEDGTCHGAIGFDEQNELVFFRAKSTVIATGGGCGIFKYSLATDEQTGDGYIMAYDEGAKLVNLEFIQFIPGLTWPVKKMLFQEKNLDTFPKITNKYGEDVLPKYLPEGITQEDCLIERARHGPFSTVGEGRYFDIAMYEEWLKDHVTETGGIRMQYDKSVLQDPRWEVSEWVKWMQSKKIDVVEGFDMIPHAQGFNGGIYINRDANVGIKGLFAAGESAGGPHGADRLGGNAQAATQVFGTIAGVSAALWAKDKSFATLDLAGLEKNLQTKFETGVGGIVDIAACKTEIREIMWESGAIVRSEEKCDKGLARLMEMEKSFDPWKHYTTNNDIKEVAGLYSYIRLAKILLQIMKFRKESRGPHYRIDYPAQDSAYEGMIAVTKKNGESAFTVIRQN
jgi:succinate dehydrogenase/fumarate reductase flavoprotein subunit